MILQVGYEKKGGNAFLFLETLQKNRRWEWNIKYSF